MGTYTQTFNLDGFARVGTQAFPLLATLPVVVNVHPAPGLNVLTTPSPVALQSVTSGLFIPEAYVPTILVLAANGQLYSELSRVQYLPAGPGVLDAGGIQWLQVGVGSGYRDWDSNYSALALVCVQTNPSQCLAPGHYAANMYFRIPGGAELPTPLSVTLDIH